MIWDVIEEGAVAKHTPAGEDDATGAWVEMEAACVDTGPCTTLLVCESKFGTEYNRQCTA